MWDLKDDLRYLLVGEPQIKIIKFHKQKNLSPGTLIMKGHLKLCLKAL